MPLLTSCYEAGLNEKVKRSLTDSKILVCQALFLTLFFARLRGILPRGRAFSFTGEICPIAIFKEKSKIGGFQT